MALSQVSWAIPAAHPELREDAIHVWRAWLDQPAGAMQDLAGLLSDEEHQRARSFRFERDRNCFIISHSALRLILSRYVHASPGQLEFSYAAGGKPYLAGMFNGGGLQFNFSYSRDLAVYAISRNHRLGIDVEYIDSELPAEQIADRFFSAHEMAMLREFPVDRGPEGFFAAWTCKEAYAKACGAGLEQPTDRLVQPRRFSSWRMSTFTAAPSYVASLAAESDAVSVSYYDLEPSEVLAHAPSAEQ